MRPGFAEIRPRTLGSKVWYGDPKPGHAQEETLKKIATAWITAGLVLAAAADGTAWTVGSQAAETERWTGRRRRMPRSTPRTPKGGSGGCGACRGDRAAGPEGCGACRGDRAAGPEGRGGDAVVDADVERHRARRCGRRDGLHGTDLQGAGVAPPGVGAAVPPRVLHDVDDRSVRAQGRRRVPDRLRHPRQGF